MKSNFLFRRQQLLINIFESDIMLEKRFIHLS
jgi:hypothetical protein